MVVLSSPDQLWSQYVSLPSTITTVKKTGQDLAGSEELAGLNYFELESKDPKLHTQPRPPSFFTPTLRYTFKVFGQQPDSGFPLFIGLHGGGGGLNQVEANKSNDKAWRRMGEGLYKRNVENDVKVGVYVATRGIVNEWNLHFRSETYALLQGLIRNLALAKPEEAKDVPTNQLNSAAKHFIDLNRVYVLGFSAGGDGVYRLSTVLSDRFGAANMSAGHPGGTRFHNLANLPLCLQVGEEDGDSREFLNDDGEKDRANEYQRNQRTVESALALKALRAANQGYGPYYSYDMFMHPTAQSREWAHNCWEEDELSNSENSDVFANWAAFREDKTTVKRNTCAIIWVSRTIRNPLPHLVVWDVSPIPEEQQPILPTAFGVHSFFYWLAVRQSDAASVSAPRPGNDTTVRVRYNPAANAIWIEQTPITLTLLLNSKMMDLTKPIRVVFGPQKSILPPITVMQYDTVQLDTLKVRGDPDYVFSASIIFDKNSEKVRDGGGQIFSTSPRARL